MIQTLFSDPIYFVSSIIAIILAIAVHEFAHAYAPDHLGDPTPRLQGRITLNPIAHLDPIGIALIALFGFGWGKPVEFDPYNLQNPRKDSAIISFAGPLTNFVTAAIAAILLRFVIPADNFVISAISSLFLFPFISFSLLLGVFNLIPVHPLDGFKIVGGLLPEDRAREWYELERYGMIMLIIMILPLFGNRSMVDAIIRPILSFLYPFFLPQLGSGIM